MLTAKDKVLDKTEGLNAGADDYLVKPFAFIELAARVRALLRRPQGVVDDVLNHAGIELDVAGMLVKRFGTEISLTALEFALLEYFMRHAGQILSKDQIVSNVWNYDADVLPNTVEVYVGYLRTKLEKPFPGQPPLIITKRGFGYRFGTAA
jgi:DNA-binding response OmpR family regulator